VPLGAHFEIRLFLADRHFIWIGQRCDCCAEEQDHGVIASEGQEEGRRWGEGRGEAGIGFAEEYRRGTEFVN